jgi:hypothetical protein
MKRTLILALGVLAVSAAAAFAQAPTTPQPPAGTAAGANFVDANGDGICDQFQAGTRQGGGRRSAATARAERQRLRRPAGPHRNRHLRRHGSEGQGSRAAPVTPAS